MNAPSGIAKGGGVSPFMFDGDNRFNRLGLLAWPGLLQSLEVEVGETIPFAKWAVDPARRKLHPPGDVGELERGTHRASFSV